MTARTPRLNRKLVFIIIAVVLMGGVGVLLAHRVQVAVNLDKAQEIAHAALKKEDWKQAAAYYRHYLQHFPESPAALEGYSTALLKGFSDRREAYELRDRLLKIDPGRSLIRREQVELAFEFDWKDAARNHLAHLLRQLPNDAHVAYLSGQCEEAEQQYGAAVGHYLRATQIEPLHPGANARLVHLYDLWQKNPRLAAQAMQQLEAGEDDSIETLEVRAGYHFRRGQIETANKLIRQAFERNHKRGALILTATRIAVRQAALHVAQNDVKLAREVLDFWESPIRDAIKRQPQSIFFDMSLAQLQGYAGDRETALQTLQTGLARVPTSNELRFQLVWQLLEDRRFADAAASIDEFPDQDSSRPFRELLAALLLLQKNDPAAASRLQEVIAVGVKPDALAPEIHMLLAASQDRSRNWPAAITLYQQAVQLNPSSRSARFSLGLAHLAAGHRLEAVRHFGVTPKLRSLLLTAPTSATATENYLRHEPALGLLIENARLELSAENHAFLRALVAAARDELEVAHGLLATQPTITERLFDLVMLAASGDAVPTTILEQAARLDRQDSRPVSALLVSWTRGQQADRVASFFRELHAGLNATQALEVIESLAKASVSAAQVLRSSHPEAAKQLDATGEALYRKLVETDRSRLPILVDYFIRSQRQTEAVDLCRQSWNAQAAQLAPLWLRAVQGHPRAAEVLRELEGCLNAALESQPKLGSSLRMARGDVFLLTSRYALAEAEFNQILKTEPNNVSALNNLAWLLGMQDRRLDEARQMIERAISVAGSQPQLLDTRGCVALARNDLSNAIADLSAATQAGGDATIHFHLAVAHRRAKNTEDAREAIQKAMALGFDASQIPPLERDLLLEMREMLATEK